MNRPSFTKATKEDARLRLALIGPAGSGKTYTALAVATAFGKRIRLIDSERGSSKKYADLFDFEVLDLGDDQSPGAYCDAIRLASDDFDGVLVIDGLSGAWSGKGGQLEQVDSIAKRSQSGNSFTAWRDVSPQHNTFVDTILASPLHVIATCRAKMAYELQENDKGRKVPVKIGMAPIQKDGLEYEFDVICDLTVQNQLFVGKTRCPALSGKVYEKAGKEFAGVLMAWLKGAPKKSVADSLPVDRPADAKSGSPRWETAGGDAAAPATNEEPKPEEAKKPTGVRALEELFKALPAEERAKWKEEAFGTDFVRAARGGSNLVGVEALRKRATDEGAMLSPAWAVLVAASADYATKKIVGRNPHLVATPSPEKAPE